MLRHVMEFLIEFGRWVFEKSDPALVIAILYVAWKQRQTDKLLAEHLNPENKNPHPAVCGLHESQYMNLCSKIDNYQEQVNGSHEETRRDLRQLSDGIINLASQKGVSQTYEPVREIRPRVFGEDQE